MTVTEYIRNNIKYAVCTNTKDNEKMVGLPYPYSVPTVGKIFHAMFYWDTYFTNLAHIALGDIKQAANNVENFAALIKRFGFIPNGSSHKHCDRSQPPFFALMVRDIFAITKDKDWLRRIYPALCTEHTFWAENRSFENGLAHYGTTVPDNKQALYAMRFAKRTQTEYTSDSQKRLAENYLAQAESGWDFNARLAYDSIHYCAIDLNSLLWALEDNLSQFADILVTGEGKKWRALAKQRATNMRRYLKKDDGVFYDRNISGAFSPYVSAASLYPLFVGLATEKEAEDTLKILPKILFPHGVVPCEEIKGGKPYQWGAPNGWPCLQVIAAVGFEKYGYKEQANKIKNLYVSMVENVFEKTGALWEKYNLLTGTNETLNEYKMPEMLGWTAGAYLYFKTK